MAAVTLITGGARCGKSAFALQRARACPAPRVFVATAEPFDGEMRTRIERHQQERGESFLTVEEPRDLDTVLQRLAGQASVVVVDCLTVWLGNLYHAYESDENRIEAHITRTLDSLRTCAMDVILVSNEVGWGIVPENALARAFRDRAGQLNRLTAAIADYVYLMCAGIALPLKEK
jgi:adenosylcobinamide kinase / adenosylcobinamide-phosphate guanylyltransferase